MHKRSYENGDVHSIKKRRVEHMESENNSDSKPSEPNSKRRRRALKKQKAKSDARAAALNKSSLIDADAHVDSFARSLIQPATSLKDNEDTSLYTESVGASPIRKGSVPHTGATKGIRNVIEEDTGSPNDAHRLPMTRSNLLRNVYTAPRTPFVPKSRTNTGPLHDIGTRYPSLNATLPVNPIGFRSSTASSTADPTPFKTSSIFGHPLDATSRLEQHSLSYHNALPRVKRNVHDTSTRHLHNRRSAFKVEHVRPKNRFSIGPTPSTPSLLDRGSLYQKDNLHRVRRKGHPSLPDKSFRMVYAASKGELISPKQNFDFVQQPEYTKNAWRVQPSVNMLPTPHSAGPDRMRVITKEELTPTRTAVNNASFFPLGETFRKKTDVATSHRPPLRGTQEKIRTDFQDMLTDSLSKFEQLKKKAIARNANLDIALKERQTKKSTDYFVVLPSGADKVITATLALSDGAQVHPGVPATVTGRDIKKLNHGVWLNDEVVNHYFQMISQRASAEGRKVHCFNSFMYKELVKNGYQKVRRWTKKVDLFAMDVILFPIHLTNHWICGCIDIRAKTISVYDSLHGRHMNVLSDLRSYLEQEHLDKKKNALDIDAWECISQMDVPSQRNGCDCGVFTCMFALYSASDKAFNFQQQNMPQIRRRMVYEIKTNNLLESTSPTLQKLATDGQQRQQHLVPPPMQGSPSKNVAVNTPALSLANQRTLPDALPSDVQSPSIPIQSPKTRAPNVTSIPKSAATERDGLKNNDMNHGGSSVARAETIELDDDEYDRMPFIGPVRPNGVFPLRTDDGESNKENASCYLYGRTPERPIVAQGTKRSHDGDNVPAGKRLHR